MRNILSHVVALLLLIILFMEAGAQQGRVTANFERVKFSSFVNEIENATGYRIFYRPADMDSFFVSLKADGLRIDQVFKSVFENTSFHFYMEGNRIYVTSLISITPGVAPDFFDRQKKPDTDVIVEPGDRTRTRAPKGLIKSDENKLYEIGNRSQLKNKATITGYVRDAKNGEALSGATLYLDSLSFGVTTDQYGYYSLTIPSGQHVVTINSPGMKTTKRQVRLYSDGKLNIDMVEYIPTLQEVVISTERKSNVRGLQMGVDKLTIRNIKQVPVVFGEADLMKVVLTLPGVTSVGEAGAGFNVRGGAADQNLILFNDMSVYNPTHLFGFFSAFNPDVVRSVELYKSVIPEKYGGRLSSVLDVRSREGNSKRLSGTGGIGLLTSKLVLEGPIIKDKTTFIISGRSTYSDWLLKRIPGSAYDNSEAGFSDVDLNLVHTINSRNSLYLNAYWSTDRFRLNSDSLYKYGNQNMIIKWKHIFSNKFYGVITAGADDYKYALSSSAIVTNAYRLSFRISQLNLRSDFAWTLNNKHLLGFGVTGVFYKLHPGSYLPAVQGSQVTPDELQAEQAMESALYLGDQVVLSPKFSLSAGLRYSLYNYLGPHDQYIYQSGVPREERSMTDTLTFAKGKNIQQYGGPELRVALRYSLGDDASVKLSYNTLRQYIHMITNTTAISPTDIWKLSDAYIKPQSGDQITAGYYRNFKSNTIETSLEIYYKHIRNGIDYKSGGKLIMNHHLETDVMNTKGKAYGAEIMLKKTAGKLNGWVNYTFSRTLLKTDDALAGEQVNGGTYYPANYDKPHNVNFISNYRFSLRYSMSLNFVYSSGRPITLPVALFTLGGGQRVYYSDRNQYRVPDYVRADLSFSMEGNHKVKQKIHNSWSFGVYNLLGRKNVYSVYFVQENGQIKGYQLSIFGTPIPFITYNFRF